MSLSDDLTLLAADGVPIAVPTFGTIFLADPPFTSIAKPVLYVFERFVGMVPADQLRWYATENMSKHKAANKRTLGMLATWLAPGAPPREYVNLELKNGDAYNAVGDIRCTVHGFEPTSVGYEVGDSGSISMAFPFAWGETRTDDMLELFLDCCNHFPFRSARAGYSFEWSRYTTFQSQPHVWLKSMQHRGIDIAWPSLEGKAVKKDAIRGVGWLNALSDEFVERLGGRSKVAAKLRAPVELIDVKGGLVLKAGAKPGIGDTQTNDYLPAYQQVYRAIEPLIAPVVGPRHPSFSLRKDRYENTEAWLRRFDV
jgi:hypothetical protein